MDHLLASLVKQLARNRPSLPESLKTFHRKQIRLSADEILETLRSVTSTYSRVFIVVDALDECQVSDGCRAKLLSELFALQTQYGVNIFATSRFIPEIAERFKGNLTLGISAKDEDVQRYLDGHMSQLPAFVRRSSELQEEIKTGIVEAVSGMYVDSPPS